MKTVCELMQTGVLGDLNADGKEAMSLGVEGLCYMQELLDDLLASAQLEAGVHELAREEIDLGILALEVVGRLKFQMDEKKVIVSVEDGLGFARVDKKGMVKVFMNLIGNAVSYSGEGEDRKITVGAKIIDERKVYFVRDNGMGIPDESKKTLFQKFKRGSNVTGITGTGLGLSIVKGIIEAHGGKIWVESTVGKGTTFYFNVG
jgi:signal transduction histidine kinase